MENACVTHKPICTVSIPTNFYHVLMYIGNDGMSIHGQLGLRRERLTATKQERTEHTLKTMRILLSSDFQVVMVSLSFRAWKSREAALRPLCLVTLFCISATVL